MNIRRAVAFGIVIGLLAVALVLAFGCAVDGEKKVNTTNNGIQVELLFTNDGCKVYRFYDWGRPVYYTDCRPAAQTSMAWMQMEGKTEHAVQSTTVSK